MEVTSSLFSNNNTAMISSLPLLSSSSEVRLEATGRSKNTSSSSNEKTASKAVPNERDGSVRVHSGSGFRFVVPFPWRLHQMLDDESASHIISWMPDGRHFHVHNPTLFVKEIIPKFFKQKSFKSFQRQLHIYGFQRVADFPNQGAYYHEKFIRSNRKLALEITRIKAPPRRRITAKAAAAAQEEKKMQAAAAFKNFRRDIQLPAARPLSSDTTEWLINAGVPFAALDPYPCEWGQASSEASIYDCASEITSIFKHSTIFWP
jgi:hypothetical protein